MKILVLWLGFLGATQIVAWTAPETDNLGNWTTRVASGRYGPFRTDPSMGLPKHAYSPFDNLDKLLPYQPASGRDFLPGRLVVKLKPPATALTTAAQAVPDVSALRQKFAAYGVTGLERVFRGAPPAPRQVKAAGATTVRPEPDLTRWLRATCAENQDVQALAKQLAADPEVEMAEPDFVRRLATADPPPLPDPTTDPLYAPQWPLAAAKVPEAWACLQSQGRPPGGSHDVVVAVIDTGVDYNHPDLAANLWMGQIAANAAPMADALATLTIPPRPELAYLEHWLFDTSAQGANNDNDGIVDAGETIDLAVVIRNHRGQASNVVVTLDAQAPSAVQPDPYVTWITNTVDYGAVGSFNRDDNGLTYDAQGAIIGVHNPFRFTVAPACPNDHLIPIRVTITAHNGLDPCQTSRDPRFQVEGTLDIRGTAAEPVELFPSALFPQMAAYLVDRISHPRFHKLASTHQFQFAVAGSQVTENLYEGCWLVVSKNYANNVFLKSTGSAGAGTSMNPSLYLLCAFPTNVAMGGSKRPIAISRFNPGSAITTSSPSSKPT
jgi:hypothetical protein